MNKFCFVFFFFLPRIHTIFDVASVYILNYFLNDFKPFNRPGWNAKYCLCQICTVTFPKFRVTSHKSVWFKVSKSPYCITWTIPVLFLVLSRITHQRGQGWQWFTKARLKDSSEPKKIPRPPKEKKRKSPKNSFLPSLHRQLLQTPPPNNSKKWLCLFPLLA